MIQWEKLKTEYITSGISYQALAEKYGVSYATLKTHARCDRWVELRQKHREETFQKSLKIIGDRQAEDLARVDFLADEMLCKLETAISELDLKLISHKEKGEDETCKWEKTYEEAVPGGIVDRQGLRQLAACLKDLKQAKAILSEQERQEQEARIQKLQKEAKEDTAQEITVKLQEDLEAFSG